MAQRSKSGTRPLGGADAPKRVKPRVPDAHLATPTQILLDSPLKGLPAQDVDTDANTLRTIAPAPELGADDFGDRTIPDPPRLPSAPRVAPPTGPTMVSMKTPAELAAARAERKSAPVQVQLRSLAESQRNHVHTPPGGYGYLAPPKEVPRGAPPWLRYLGMAAACLAIAVAVATVVWLVAT